MPSKFCICHVAVILLSGYCLVIVTWFIYDRVIVVWLSCVNDCCEIVISYFYELVPRVAKRCMRVYLWTSWEASGRRCCWLVTTRSSESWDSSDLICLEHVLYDCMSLYILYRVNLYFYLCYCVQHRYRTTVCTDACFGRLLYQLYVHNNSSCDEKGPRFSVPYRKRERLSGFNQEYGNCWSNTSRWKH